MCLAELTHPANIGEDARGPVAVAEHGDRIALAHNATGRLTVSVDQPRRSRALSGQRGNAHLSQLAGG